MAAADPAPAAPVATEDVDPNDPEVQACASFALESFSHFRQDPHLYSITKFYSVKRANIGGGQYDMDVEVTKAQPTTEEQAERDSSHTLTSPEAQVFRCQFVVLSVPWKNQRVLIQSTCTPVQQ
ncbi:hypothetical protein MATL_G00152060 [Megalops atlanticus]|uniref:Cystatin domain-containing protein n=1 Tax=Megalops atlanticus TaxID=7932 RepID=A0A9D3T342_MEGAT|nr:hypothetical protein MATL_G00152060 [Megalops atlanticus]